jgi:hypothetical protein
MLSFALDENFNLHIVNGVLRRLPTVDMVRVQDVALEGQTIQPCLNGQLARNSNPLSRRASFPSYLRF